MATVKEIMTPEQAADYLQLNKETVYRYIREGKLAASRLGRNYRIPKENIDLFLLATSTDKIAREALFNRLENVAERNKDIPFEQVEQDVAEAVKEVRRKTPARFSKSDVSKLTHLNSKTNPLLADIWRGEENDEYASP